MHCHILQRISLSYRNKTDETRRQVAASRKRQRQQSSCTFSDKDSEFGPPDKRAHFSTEMIINEHGAAKMPKLLLVKR